MFVFLSWNERSPSNSTNVFGIETVFRVRFATNRWSKENFRWKTEFYFVKTVSRKNVRFVAIVASWKSRKTRNRFVSTEISFMKTVFGANLVEEKCSTFFIVDRTEIYFVKFVIDRSGFFTAVNVNKLKMFSFRKVLSFERQSSFSQHFLTDVRTTFSSNFFIERWLRERWTSFDEQFRTDFCSFIEFWRRFEDEEIFFASNIDFEISTKIRAKNQNRSNSLVKMFRRRFSGETFAKSILLIVERRLFKQIDF